ncbi:hypothetical protein FACS189425_02220 [Clostridia bacterium]|nr:hypothetical protein FACS189425_02220 [Clostridia bacterium]
MDYPQNFNEQNSTPQTANIEPLLASSVPRKPIEWFYPNVFVRGELNGIQGTAGVGKTFLLCELAAQTSIGGVVQGTADANDVAELPQGNVLYFAGDDSTARLTDRLEMCGADMDKIAFQPDGTLPQIGSPEMAVLFEKMRPALCIIDTLQYFVNGANTNDMCAMTAALQPLQQLARQYNTAVVVLMHVGKYAAQGNAGDSTSYAIGSYAIAGIFRTLWTLGRLKDEESKPTKQRALCVSKNNYVEDDPPAILFRLENGFHWDGINADIFAEDLYTKKNNKGRPAEKRDFVKSVVRRFLESGEPVLSSELEEKVIATTGCSVRTLKTVKEDLGVQSYQSERRWFCCLPGQSAENVQSAKIRECGQAPETGGF